MTLDLYLKAIPALIFILIAVIAAREEKSPRRRFFLPFLAVMAVIAFCFPIDGTPESLKFLFLIGITLLSAVFFLSSLHFAGINTKMKWAALFWLAVTLLYFIISGLAGSRTFLRDPYMLINPVIWFILSIWFLGRELPKLKDSFLRHRIFRLIASSVLFIAGLILMISAGPELAYIPLVLFSFAVASAVSALYGVRPAPFNVLTVRFIASLFAAILLSLIPTAILIKFIYTEGYSVQNLLLSYFITTGVIFAILFETLKEKIAQFIGPVFNEKGNEKESTEDKKIDFEDPGDPANLPKTLTSLLNIKSCHFFMPDPVEHRYVMRYSWPPVEKSGFLYGMPADAFFVTNLEERGIVVFSEEKLLSPGSWEKNSSAARGMIEELEGAVAVDIPGKDAGFILLGDKDEKGAFTEEDFLNLKKAALQSGAFLKNHRSFMECEKRNRIGRILLDFSKRLNGARTPEEIYATIGETASDVLGNDGNILFVRLPDDEEFKCVYFDGVFLEDSFTMVTMINEFRESLLGLKKPVVYQNRQTRAMFMEDFHVSSFKSALVAPVVLDGVSVGILGCFNTRREDSFSEYESNIISVLSNNSAAALKKTLLINEVMKEKENIESLISAPVMAREMERRRIASEIHDTVAQSMAAALTRIQICEQMVVLSQPGTHEELQLLRKIIKENIAEIRRIIMNLKPPSLEKLGLVGTMKKEIASFEKQYGLNVDFNAADVPESLKQSVEITAFRILQESLHNIRKHAKAKKVIVDFRGEGSNLILVVTDDGKGFDVDSLPTENFMSGFGLTGMKSRLEMMKGKFEIKSKPGEGTVVTVSIPAGSAGVD